MRQAPPFVFASVVALLHGLIAAPTAAQVLVNYGDVWKYKVPTSDPGTSWRALSFDDSTWGSGPGLLGFETTIMPAPGMQTPVGNSGTQMSYLFRRSFNFTGDPTGKHVVLDQIIDDGVSYYLNGQWIGSTRHIASGVWDAPANPPTVGDASQEFGVLTFPATSLNSGSNVLAAEVHQANAGSSDMVFGAKLTLATAPAQPASPGIQHVIYISVDGLRGHFIQHFIETAPTEFPNFVRLRNMSAYTYNARCDYSQSVTIPNHVGMLTGRPISQPAGMANTVHHGYTENFPNPGDTVHAQGNPSVPYKHTVLDVVHDRGFSTALYLDKLRLTICQTSFDASHGAQDTIGVDNGRNKINFSQIVDYNPGALVSTLASHIASGLENFTFLHIGIVDQQGHAGGWDAAANSPYRNAVKTTDTHLGTILDALAANSSLNGKVALIISADHGGGGDADGSGNVVLNNHSKYDSVENYTIGMFVSGPGFRPGSDLYEHFENRVNPALGRPSYADAMQPIRNVDAGNLAVSLLGLPQIPGSLAAPKLKRMTRVVRSGSSVKVTWPSYLTNSTLQYTDDLRTGSWTNVSSGITEANGLKSYTYTPGAQNSRVFRVLDPPAN